MHWEKRSQLQPPAAAVFSLKCTLCCAVLCCAASFLLAQVLDILKETGYSEDRFFIHCDGALFGMMVRCAARAVLRVLCCAALWAPRGRGCCVGRQEPGPVPPAPAPRPLCLQTLPSRCACKPAPSLRPSPLPPIPRFRPDPLCQAGAHGDVQEAHRLRERERAQVCGRAGALRSGDDPPALHQGRLLGWVGGWVRGLGRAAQGCYGCGTCSQH